MGNGLLQIVFTPGQDKCFLCGQMGHVAADCEGKAKRKSGDFDEKGGPVVAKKPFQVDLMKLNLRAFFMLSHMCLTYMFSYSVSEHLDSERISGI